MKQPIYCEFDLAQLSRSPRLLAVAHTDDTDTEQLELRVKQDGAPVDLTDTAVTARIVTAKENYLLSDNVPCTVNGSGNILIPFDNAVIHAQRGELKIEVNLTRGDKVLTLQFPLHVRFNGSILDTAEVTPASQGTVPELLREAREQLSRVEGFVTEEDVNTIVDGKGFLTEHQDISGKQDKLAVGTGNELVDAAGNGTMKRSGYRVTANKNVIVDKASAENFIPTARIVAQYVAEHGGEGAKGDDGKSAYEVAVDNGFEGTEQEWLASLKGDKGDKGNDYVLTDADKQAIAQYAATLVDISGKADKATTLSGYGITNAYTRVDINNLLSGKANASHTHEQYLTAQDISGKANTADVPTKTSDLQNDSGFLTQHQTITPSTVPMVVTYADNTTETLNIVTGLAVSG